MEVPFGWGAPEANPRPQEWGREHRAGPGLACPRAVWGQVDRMFPQAVDIPSQRWQAVGDLPFPFR